MYVLLINDVKFLLNVLFCTFLPKVKFYKEGRNPNLILSYLIVFFSSGFHNLFELVELIEYSMVELLRSKQ